MSSYTKAEIDAKVNSLTTSINQSNSLLTNVNSLISNHKIDPSAHEALFDDKATNVNVTLQSKRVDDLNITIQDLMERLGNLESISGNIGLKGTLNYPLTGTVNEAPVSIKFDIKPIDENNPVTYEVYGNGTLLPGLTFNATAGTISGTPTVGGTTTYVVLAKSGRHGVFITVNQNFEAIRVISVTPVDKVTATATEAITDIQIQYQITDPVEGVEATLTASGLPPGLTMSSSGVISGTPTEEGTYTSTIVVSYKGAESVSITIEYVIEHYYSNVITVDPVPTIVGYYYPEPYGDFTGDPIDPVRISYKINGQTTTKGATFTALSDLPSGLTLGANTGVISGTPQSWPDGTKQISITYSDAKPVTVKVEFEIIQIEIGGYTFKNFIVGEVGLNLSTRIGRVIKGAPTQFTYKIIEGTLPDGLTLSPEGLISGTPTKATGGNLLTIGCEYIEDDILKVYEKYDCVIVIASNTVTFNSVQTMLNNNDIDGLNNLIGTPIIISMLDEDGGTYERYVKMVAVNHDVAAENESANTVRFDFIDTPYESSSHHRFHSTNDITAYKAADVRGLLNDDLLSRIPESLQNLIVPAKVVCFSSAGSTTTEVLEDKLFLPSAYELGEDYSKIVGEGSVIPYYSQDIDVRFARSDYDDRHRFGNICTRSMILNSYNKVNVAYLRSHSNYRLIPIQHITNDSSNFSAPYSVAFGSTSMIYPSFILAGGTNPETYLNNIVTTLRSGDVSTLVDKLGVPITIPLTDSDGVTRNYRIMMTSINTDDTPGYERNARFEFLDIVDTRKYDAGGDNAYETSDIRSYLTSEANDGFMTRLPAWLKDMIVPTNIECVKVYNNSATHTLTDKVFLPSAWELNGAIYEGDWWYQEGTKSTYYPTSTDAGDKQVRYDLSGESQYWWTRTPYRDDESVVYNGVITVCTDGLVANNYSCSYSRGRGVAPAFVIA